MLGVNFLCMVIMMQKTVTVVAEWCDAQETRSLALSPALSPTFKLGP